MKITKLGHCCFIAEPKDGVRIMTDPGHPDYSGEYVSQRGIAAVIITHEHADHLHIEGLKEVLKNNPEAVIITNSSVGKLLTEANIKFIKVEQNDSCEVAGIKILGFGNTHATIYEGFGQVQNTGFMIGGLCYPGDSYNYPSSMVDILALPVAGPWMKIMEAIDYAKKIKPRIVFPVHDAMIKPFATFLYKIPEHFLTKEKIEFKKLELGKEEEL